METLSLPQPRSGTREQWNEASRRLETWLETFEIGDEMHALRLRTVILRQAMDRHAATPGLHPTTVTQQEAIRVLENWFKEVIGRQGENPGQTLSNGLLALFLSRSGQLWPEAIGAANPPAELREAMQKSSLQLGPDLQISTMTPREIDYGPLSSLARETWQQWEWAPILRALIFWAIIYCAGYYLLT